MLDVNVIGMARVTRAALPHLRRSQHAAVVNTCSTVAFVGAHSRAGVALRAGRPARVGSRPGLGSHRVTVALTGPDPQHAVHGADPDLPVADSAGIN